MKSKRKEILKWLSESFKDPLNDEEKIVLSSSKIVIDKLLIDVINKISVYERHNTDRFIGVSFKWFYTERPLASLYNVSIFKNGFLVTYSRDIGTVIVNFMKELDFNHMIEYINGFLTNREIHLPPKI